MQITNTFGELANLTQPTAVAIGNFDGVHLGHKKILGLLVELAQKKGLFSVALTFSPHPGKITGKGQIKLLHTLSQKLDKMAAFGLDMVFVLPFDKNIAELQSSEFFHRVLIQALHTQAIVVGQNFRFGKDRTGDISTLKSLAHESRIVVDTVPSVKKDGYIISSSTIRELVQEGKMESANGLLGSPHEIIGTVIKGRSRGKILGFPTANIQTPNEIIPLGVFITSIQIQNQGNWYPAVTNVGTSPTFQPEQQNVETHILDLQQDLYGNKVVIRFLKKIRDEIKFPSPAALSAQIHQDVNTARLFFAQSS